MQSSLIRQLPLRRALQCRTRTSVTRRLHTIGQAEIGTSQGFADEDLPARENSGESGNGASRMRTRLDRPLGNVTRKTQRQLEIVGNQIHVHSQKKDKYLRATPIPGQWLRDMCACPTCRNQDTQQRNVNVFRDPALSTIKAIRQQDSLFEITFADDHVTTVQQHLILMRNSMHLENWRLGLTRPKLWDNSIAAELPSVDYSEVVSGAGMKQLTLHIRQYGFVLVDGMPPTPEASQSLLESIGPIRNTHYGGFYDFTADLASKDTAYTSEALEPHTDNTYFTDPAGLQALHMLSHTDGSGGESILVDGFKAAQMLRERSEEFYDRLCATRLTAHASGNEGISIQGESGFPTLRRHPKSGGLLQVRWNNADRAGIVGSFATVEKWYEAAAEFDQILNTPESQYVFQLHPGTMLIFDNWRVLHGRTAFTGKRRMCGGYINRDDWISKYRSLNLTPRQLRASTVTG